MNANAARSGLQLRAGRRPTSRQRSTSADAAAVAVTGLSCARHTSPGDKYFTLLTTTFTLLGLIFSLKFYVLLIFSNRLAIRELNFNFYSLLRCISLNFKRINSRFYPTELWDL